MSIARVSKANIQKQHGTWLLTCVASISCLLHKCIWMITWIYEISTATRVLSMSHVTACVPTQLRSFSNTRTCPGVDVASPYLFSQGRFHRYIHIPSIYHPYTIEHIDLTLLMPTGSAHDPLSHLTASAHEPLIISFQLSVMTFCHNFVFIKSLSDSMSLPQNANASK